MVAFTTAKGLYQVANSSYVGTWDQPENSNWGVVDAALGQITTVQLNNTPVTLTANQVQCAQIVFSSSAAPGGLLTGNIVISFPTVSPSSTPLTGPYIIQNLCGNSSLFTVTLKTTVAGGQVVACKPGEPFDVINDGVNFKFKNLGHIGSYWDYAGSSVPNWVTACTIPPYLNCDASTFSSATYPTLAAITGTTLPDGRGRARAALNQGTGRMTTAGGGVDGNTLFAAGGSETHAQTLAEVPPHDHSYVRSAPGFDWASQGFFFVVGAIQGFGFANSPGLSTPQTGSAGGGTAMTITQPSYIGGITMIRAA